MRVLLIEDDSIDTRAIRKFLTPPGRAQRGSGFEITHRETLSSAIECLGQDDIDVVLLDLTLPDAEGLQALHAVLDHRPGTPVVVLTGHDDDKLALEAVRDGAQDYLTKDRLSGEVLRRSLKYAVERQWLKLAAERADRLAREYSERRASELARSNVELKLFTKVVSHIFQMPLQSITTAGRELQEHHNRRKDTLANALLGHILESTTRLQSIVHGLIAYMAVDADAKEFTKCDCRSAIAEAISQLQGPIHTSQAEVTYDENLQCVVGDPDQIRHLFRHLLDNAIKFHGGERPRVRISAETCGPEQVISVEDNGLGVPREIGDQVFHLFRRAHGVDYSGSGSGLAIARKIVERHGGRIWVEPARDRGSAFRFSIPVWSELHGEEPRATA